MPNAAVNARGFVSYHRRDDASFGGVVQQIRDELSGRFAAKTGRDLDLFLDRESIGWGADWRSAIRESVETATFFIPVVSMRYFASDACREELIAFVENARQLGVEELIMPIVITGAEQITSDHESAEVRLIERLNFRDIERSWLDGADSPAWRRDIAWMVDQMSTALAVAEQRLEEREQKGTDEAGVSEAETEDAQGDIEALGVKLQTVTDLAHDLQSAMTDFAEASNSLNADRPTDPSRAQAYVLRIASSIKQPGQRLGDAGVAFEAGVAEVDAELRSVISELRSIDATPAREQEETLLTAVAKVGDMTSVVEGIESMVGSLRVAALTNVSLRKALAPVLKGIQSMRNGLEIVRSWHSI